MCKKQTSVSHAEIISLDASLRMDGIPALDLWDLVIEVFHSPPNQSKKTEDQVRGDLSRNTTSNKHTQNQFKTPIHHDNLELSDVDQVSSNAKSSQFGAMLYTFEDNEAVIKMIIKGRSPTMRHLSRTHRVALDWLFDSINFDPKIQVEHVDTKNQLADLLTEKITRDQWHHLLCLSDMMNSSMFTCSQFSPISKPKTMQEEKFGEEERVVPKPKPR